jgi:hypothetical protein
VQALLDGGGRGAKKQPLRQQQNATQINVERRDNHQRRKWKGVERKKRVQAKKAVEI